MTLLAFSTRSDVNAYSIPLSSVDLTNEKNLTMSVFQRCYEMMQGLKYQIASRIKMMPDVHLNVKLFGIIH